LVFFYLLAIFAFIADVAVAVYLVIRWIDSGLIPPLAAIALTFLAVTSLNSMFFAFWMDMQVNEPLAVRVPEFFEIRSELAERAPAGEPDASD
jgi:hypothetical protein